MKQIVSRDYFGFGDNIYKRPFIKALARVYDEVYLYTAFPELFSDIPNVKFCKPSTNLKTQAEHIKKHERLGTYVADASHHIPTIKLNYGRNFKLGINVIQSFEQEFTLENDSLVFDLPNIEEGKDKATIIYNTIPKDKKLCIVRLPSVRNEWSCETRNALMIHFKRIMEVNKDKFYFLSIGDIDENERFSEPPPLELIDYKYHNKELNLYETLNMIKLADCTLSIPCFTLPLCIALKVPAFFIYGGYVKHDLLVDPRMDLSKIDYVAPDPFCNCITNTHNCNKRIEETTLLTKFNDFVNKTT